MALRPLINHVQQIDWGYCLPACAEMALSQLGVSVSQQRLAKQLGTVAKIGTPFPNVQRLAKLGAQVKQIQWQGVNALSEALRLDLPGWGTLRTQHVVVVTAIDAVQISYHDPALPYGPATVQLDAFLLAWSDMSEQVQFFPINNMTIACQEDQ